MGIVLLGYHNMGCMALKVLKRLGCEVSAVFTHEDDPNENRWFDSLSDLANSMDIKVFYPKNINTPEWIDILKSMSPDIILSCYYRNLVKQQVLDIPKIAAVNLHGSLLPAYRGRCPVNWQIINGEKLAGVTLHHMVLKADAGDIIAQQSVEISDDDTALTLFKKMEQAGDKVLYSTIPKLLDGTAPRIPQDESKASYFGGRRPEDGIIDWNKDARSIYNLIRGVTWPYPGAFTYLNDGTQLTIWWAVPRLQEGEILAPGTVTNKEGRFLVQTGDGMLELKTVTKGNKPPQSADPINKILTPGTILQS